MLSYLIPVVLVLGGVTVGLLVAVIVGRASAPARPSRRFNRSERERDAKLHREAVQALRIETKDARHHDEYADTIYRSLRERHNAYPPWDWPE